MLSILDRWLAPAPDPTRVGWLRGVTYAHRGLHGGGRIENSPSAFAAAIAASLGIECDVQVSADGEAMVFHDWELDRLTGQIGPVRARDSSELERIRLSGNGDAIWTLPQLLAEVGGRVPLLIEIKSRREAPYADLCQAVRKALEGYAGPVAAMSFDPRVVRWFARHAPATIRGLVVTEHKNRTRRGAFARRVALWRTRPDFLAYDVRDLRGAFARSQRRRGLPLLTWTVATPVQRERAQRHADGYIAEGEGVASVPSTA